MTHDGIEAELARTIIGESDCISRVRREVMQFGRARLPILIVGPTGAGKELVARALHRASARTGSLVALNVCAVSDGMFEAALFGHVKGAFTGAHQDARGYLGEANGGSIFLDEISGLSMASQAKLLRALEDGVYRPIGGSRDRHSDFRLITASNEEVNEMAVAHRFRADLLHRIGGYVIRVPSLRERPEDMPQLLRHFSLTVAAHEMSFTPQAMRLLRRQEWPGNVRELRNVVERLVALADGCAITEHLVEVALQSHSSVAGTQGFAEGATLDDLMALLDEHEWDTLAVAQALNIHRATVYRWIKRLGARARKPREASKAQLSLVRKQQERLSVRVAEAS